MKILYKILILGLLSTKALAQYIALEPNKVKIDNNNEFGSLVGSMALRNNNPNSKPVLYFWDTPTNKTTGFIGASIFPNTFGIFSSNTLILGSSSGIITVSSAGNTGIDTSNPTTKFEVNGFSKLGSDAPAIKVKKLTTTTSSTQGGQVSIAHGLTESKILSISVMVEYGIGQYVHPAYLGAGGYQFEWYSTTGGITIWNRSSNSSFILSRPVKILITYEE